MSSEGEVSEFSDQFVEGVLDDLVYELRFARIRYASLLRSLESSSAMLHGELSSDGFVPEAGLVAGQGLAEGIAEIGQVARMVIRYTVLIPLVESDLDWSVVTEETLDNLTALRELNNEMRNEVVE